MNCCNTIAALRKIANFRENLSDGESRAVFGEIMDGAVDAQTLAAFLTALKMKGETVDEVVGAASAMRKKAAFINSGVRAPSILAARAATDSTLSIFPQLPRLSRRARA